MPTQDRPKRIDPCDEEPFICPYNAQGGMDCRNYCGLGVDESGDNKTNNEQPEPCDDAEETALVRARRRTPHEGCDGPSEDDPFNVKAPDRITEKEQLFTCSFTRTQLERILRTLDKQWNYDPEISPETIEDNIMEQLYHVKLEGMPMIYLTEYTITRSYGGPEEGGWWWDAKEPGVTRGFDNMQMALDAYIGDYGFPKGQCDKDGAPLIDTTSHIRDRAQYNYGHYLWQLNMDKPTDFTSATIHYRRIDESNAVALEIYPGAEACTTKPVYN